MEGRGSSSRGRCKAASQEPCGSGQTRSSRARILSNSPNEHQGEGRAMTCSGGGESSSGGDENLQGSRMKQQGAWTRWENAVERKVNCSHLDTNWGLISPGWVTWRRAYDVERPETSNDSITEDVSRLGISRCMYTVDVGRHDLHLPHFTG